MFMILVELAFLLDLIPTTVVTLKDEYFKYRDVSCQNKIVFHKNLSAYFIFIKAGWSLEVTSGIL